jgi:hypothetical protein
MFLKQSTSVVIPFGPFVDKGDGVALEVGLVSALDNASTGIMLSKGGGALAVRSATVTASTYDAHGNYLVTLSATDTGTLGRLRVQYTDAATCLPVWQDFIVLTAQVFNSMVGGTDLLDVNASEHGGTSQTGRDIGASVLLSSGTGTGQVSLSSGRANADIVYVNGGAVSTSTAQLGVNVVNAGGTAWGSGAITSGAFAAGAITAAAVASGAIDADALATDAVSEITAAIKALVIETNGSITVGQALSVILAACAGVTTTGGIVLKDPSGTSTRITAAINGSNERTGMTLTPSA